jgi:hypothetical protein
VCEVELPGCVVAPLDPPSPPRHFDGDAATEDAIEFALAVAAVARRPVKTRGAGVPGARRPHTTMDPSRDAETTQQRPPLPAAAAAELVGATGHARDVMAPLWP